MIFLIPYTLLLLIGILSIGKPTKAVRFWSCAAMFVVLTLIMGLRKIDYAGEDTIVYARDFERIVSNNLSFIDILTREFEKDYLFYLIARVFSYISPDVNLWILACAAFYVYAFSWLIYKYSKNIFLSYMIFMTWDFYLYNFQLMRHCFSLAFVILSLKFVIERNWKKFIVFYLGAATSQIVSVVSGITYFLKNISRRNLGILGFIFFLFFFFIISLPRETLISLIFSSSLIDNDRFDQFKTRGGDAVTNAVICIAFIAVSIFFVLRNKKKYRLYPEYQNMPLFLMMSFFGLVFYSMMFLVAEMYRVAQYFSFVTVIMVPLAMSLEKTKSVKLIVILLISAFCLKHFWGGFLTSTDYYPYKFFWE